MNQKRAPDASLERLLQRMHQATPNTTAGTSCLDAETLAAWSEGSLRGAERAAAEGHAADCVRCQAMLAAMVRIEPDVSGRTARWQRGAVLRWAVPLTAAVAAVSIWVLTEPRDRFDQQERMSDTPAAPRTPTAPAPETPQEGRIDAVQEPGTAARAGRSASAPAASARPETAPAREVENQASDLSAQRRRDEAASTAARAEAVLPQSPPPAAPAIPRPTSLAETVTVAEPMRKAAQAPVDTFSPDGSIRWRAGGGGLVQRSTDSGATWQTQHTGVTADLLAASAPSSSICWAVGRAGTVLVTTDGRTWRRLTFPETADLVAVTATNADAADVTAADGRVFRTADGGATWVIR